MCWRIFGSVSSCFSFAGRFLYQDFVVDKDVSGTWEVNSEVTVERTTEGVAFSTSEIHEHRLFQKPLMWYEISDPAGWIYSLRYQLDLNISEALNGAGGADPVSLRDDHEGFPIHMVITAVKPSEMQHTVWPEVNYLGFTSFTVIRDTTVDEEGRSSASHITLYKFDYYVGYSTEKEYFGRRTQLREGVVIESPPFMAPVDHDGPLYAVVVGTGNASSSLQFVELAKMPERSAMPVVYACHARSHVIEDTPPKLDCALAEGRKSKKQCSSAWKYDLAYAGNNDTGCMTTPERETPSWCVLTPDENGLCRDGCKDEDEGVTWDYCVDPVNRQECIEFCEKTVGASSGEVCAENWYTGKGILVQTCTTVEDRVSAGSTWCALQVSQYSNVCAEVWYVYVLCVSAPFSFFLAYSLGTYLRMHFLWFCFVFWAACYRTLVGLGLRVRS
jgi:hypothetical protein